MSRVTQHLTAASRADYNILQSGDAGSAEPGSGSGSAAYAKAGDASAASARVKASVSAEEWQLRCDLAAAYRIVALNQWDDSINNHLTVRVPGTQHFLINCFGEGFEEVTASSLVKIDNDGNVIAAGSRGSAVNAAGFVIHSAMHAAREDAHCVAHTHEANITAVSCDEQGLMPVNQTALLCGKISYHDFQGVAVSTDERASLAADMLPDSTIMILRNHGVLCVGASVAQCVTRLYYVHKAAEIQCKVRASGAAVNQVHEDVQRLVQTEQTVARPVDTEGPIEMYCAATFQHLKRRLDRVNPGYAQ